MPKFSSQFLLLTTLVSALTFYANTALAELGGAPNTEAVLVQTLSPVVSVEQHLNVYQISMPSGTQIREYTNANNVVVAVSWQGPTLPNLKQLMGSSFDTFVTRPNKANGDRHNAEFTSDDLIVQSHGRMRNFAGRAYLPKLLPPGYNLDQIK